MSGNTDESKIEEEDVTSPFYDSFTKRNLKTDFTKLQEAVNKRKDRTRILHILEQKAVPFGFMTCVMDQTAALVVNALRRNDFGVLSKSHFKVYELISAVSIALRDLEEIDNNESAVACDLIETRTAGAAMKAFMS